jgi:hypothetical protein
MQYFLFPRQILSTKQLDPYHTFLYLILYSLSSVVCKLPFHHNLCLNPIQLVDSFFWHLMKPARVKVHENVVVVDAPKFFGATVRNPENGVLLE